MHAYDFTIVAPHSKGSLANLAEELGREKINIEGVFAVEQDGSAIFRMLTTDKAATTRAITKVGYKVTRETEVTVEHIEDRPGMLGKVSRRTVVWCSVARTCRRSRPLGRTWRLSRPARPALWNRSAFGPAGSRTQSELRIERSLGMREHKARTLGLRDDSGQSCTAENYCHRLRSVLCPVEGSVRRTEVSRVKPLAARHALHRGTVWEINMLRSPDEVRFPTIVRCSVAVGQPDEAVGSAMDASLRHCFAILPSCVLCVCPLRNRGETVPRWSFTNSLRNLLELTVAYGVPCQPPRPAQS
jgi:hypothetical protein